MKNIVSFETANRLKEAGFPQPEYIDAGFCYDHNGELIYIRECSFPPGGAYGLTFATTATDILEQLPDYAIVFSDLYDPKGFSCYDTMRRIPDQYPVTHENPAEAAALAWLETNEKK